MTGTSRTRLSLWGIALCAILLVSCGEEPSSRKPRELVTLPAAEPVTGDWLVQRIQAEPDTLNTIVATDYYEGLINGGMSGQVYETLIYRNPRTLKWDPLLAESWEESPDHLTYTFHLRKGIKWHNGQPFTSDDVVYSVQRVLDPSVQAAHLRGYYKNLEKIEALDDYTVRFTFSVAEYLSFEIAGNLHAIIPRSVFDDGQDFNTHPAGRSPVGTGPYKFKSWRTGQEIVLERNPDYWGEAIGRKPHLDQLVFRIAPDPTAALQQLKAGQLDMMTRILQVQWVKQLSSRSFTSKFDKYEYYLPSYSYIGWNSLRPYFADKRCRRAMTHLIDRQKFIDKVLYGLAHIVTGNLFFQSPYYDSSIEPWPYDPEEAKRLLDEAGWSDHDGDGIRDKDGVRFEFKFTIPAGSKNAEKIATLLKEELEQVGIIMDIERMEWALFIQRMQNKEFDASTLQWSMPWSVDLYQIWHSSSAGPMGSNYVSFKNEEADKIIVKLRETFDEEERIKLCHRFHQIVHEEQPYTFMYCGAELMAVDKRFEGVETFRIRPGYEQLEWWTPKALQKYP